MLAKLWRCRLVKLGLPALKYPWMEGFITPVRACTQDNTCYLWTKAWEEAHLSWPLHNPKDWAYSFSTGLVKQLNLHLVEVLISHFPPLQRDFFKARCIGIRPAPNSPPFSLENTQNKKKGIQLYRELTPATLRGCTDCFLFNINTIKVIRVAREKAGRLFPAADKALVYNQILLKEIKMEVG